MDGVGGDVDGVMSAVPRRGDEGLDPSLREEADEALSLSRMTFTHEMARAILLEQLFRAVKPAPDTFTPAAAPCSQRGASPAREGADA